MVFQPVELTEEMIRMAFKIWLGDVSLWKCPLVASNGTLLKFALKPGESGVQVWHCVQVRISSHNHKAVLFV